MKKIFTVLLVAFYTIAMVNAQAPVIVLVTPDDRDDAQYEFLMNQGFNVIKVWPNTGHISEVGPDTLALLNNQASLVIVGRSGHSSFFQDSADRVTWNGLTVPLILNGQYLARSNRLKWFDSGKADHENETPLLAYGEVTDPGDPIFSGITLDGDSLGWCYPPHDFIYLTDTTTTNGTVLVTYKGTNPLVARFEAGVEFYPGSVDMPAGPRTYFGFGNDAVNFDDPNFFPLSKAAKQIYLNEITNILGIPAQEAVFGVGDQRVVLVTDDQFDNEQYDWLVNQGFNVTKFWHGTVGEEGVAGGNRHISEVDQDTIDMLNAADLLIVGRSPHSSNFQDSADRVVWNALTAPMILNGQYLARSNRLKWFDSGKADHENVTPLLAYGEVTDPGDPIFSDVTLDGDSLGWCYPPHDFIYVGEGVATNGDVLVTYKGTNPLVARFEAGVEFYPGSVDMPGGPRTYFGFGNDASGPSNFFPLTRDAKKVYLAEICMMTGIEEVPEVVFSPADYSVVFITDDQFDNPQINFLTKNGISVTKFWHGTVGEEGVSGGNRHISEVHQDTIDMLNAADLLIIGRSPHSSNFQDSADRVVWNALTAPMILNGQYLARSSRLKWFDSGKADHENDGPAIAYGATTMPDDPIFSNVTLKGDSLGWCLPPHDFIYLTDTTATNGTVLVTYKGVNPLVARFETGVEFYPGSVDMPAGPRSYFGFGNDATGFSNFFPLTEEAQQVYLNEIAHILGAAMMEAKTVSTDATLASLEYDVVTATLTPAFSKDSVSYMLQLVEDSSVVELTAAPTDANATVVGDSTIDVSSGDTLMTVIVVTAENGGQKKYEVTVYPFVSETSVKPEEAQELGIKLFPNPASDMIYIEAEAEISQVTVFNAIGRVVLDQTYRNNQRVQLNVGSLIPGLYMIRVDSEGQSAMVKLLKR